MFESLLSLKKNDCFLPGDSRGGFGAGKLEAFEEEEREKSSASFDLNLSNLRRASDWLLQLDELAHSTRVVSLVTLLCCTRIEFSAIVCCKLID